MQSFMHIFLTIQRYGNDSLCKKINLPKNTLKSINLGKYTLTYYKTDSYKALFTTSSFRYQ